MAHAVPCTSGLSIPGTINVTIYTDVPVGQLTRRVRAFASAPPRDESWLAGERLDWVTLTKTPVIREEPCNNVLPANHTSLAEQRGAAAVCHTDSGLTPCPATTVTPLLTLGLAPWPETRRAGDFSWAVVYIRPKYCCRPQRTCKYKETWRLETDALAGGTL
jgi:hypothetical protein